MMAGSSTSSTSISSAISKNPMLDSTQEVQSRREMPLHLIRRLSLYCNTCGGEHEPNASTSVWVNRGTLNLHLCQDCASVVERNAQGSRVTKHQLIPRFAYVFDYPTEAMEVYEASNHSDEVLFKW